MRRNLWPAVLCCLLPLLFSSAPSAHAAARFVPVVLVAELTADGVEREAAAAISALLRGELAANPGVHAVAHSKVKALLREVAVDFRGRTDAVVASELARMLGAAKVVVGGVARRAERVIIRARVIDVASGAEEFAAEVAAEQQRPAVRAAVTDLARQLGGRLAPGAVAAAPAAGRAGAKGGKQAVPRAAPGANAPLQLKRQLPKEVTRNLEKARLLYRRRQYGKAMDLLKKVLRAAPDWDEAVALRAQLAVALGRGPAVAAGTPREPGEPPDAVASLPVPEPTVSPEQPAAVAEPAPAPITPTTPATPAAAPAPWNPDAVAVVIGNRAYRAEHVPAVAFAGRDAAAVGAFLVDHLGYDPANIIQVDDAALSDFFQLFGTSRSVKGQLYNWVKAERSDVFVYYAGHGAPDPETQGAFFVPADANPDYIAATGYPLDLFWQNLAAVPARSLTVVLDACFSGNSEQGPLITNVSPALLKVRADHTTPADAVVMTSAAPDQLSTWYPEKEHSLFTYWWLHGARGAADADADGAVTAGEMKGYLAEQVPYWARRLSAREQTPVVRGPEEQVVSRLGAP